MITKRIAGAKKPGKKTKAGRIAATAKQAVLDTQIAESLQEMRHIDATVYSSDREYVTGWLGTLESCSKELLPPAYKDILLAKIVEVRAIVTDSNINAIRCAVELADMFNRPHFETEWEKGAPNREKSADFEKRVSAMRTAYAATPQPRKQEAWCLEHASEYDFSPSRAQDLLAGL